MRTAFAIVVALVLAGGCAKYEYDVASPPHAAAHVGTKADHTFALDPLEYRLRTVDNRLVMRVYNPTEDTVTLLGTRSAAVDPDGQSHPLPTLSIAPGGSFIKLIIPPPRPRIYGGGPTFGIGVGAVYGGGHFHHHDHHHCASGVYDPFFAWPYDTVPQYLTVYDDNDALYWDWKGEGEARLSLVYARGEHADRDAAGATFAHELVIRRVKVK